MKDSLIHIRLSQQEKKKFEQAESLLHLSSLSDFIRRAAHMLAESAFEESRKLTLSNEERDRVLDALANPPKPNKRLREAMKRYREVADR